MDVDVSWSSVGQVRFQHEVYPEEAAEASRQVLAVGEIEIRDRLAHSPINKFLYQYCSEQRPRQAHANMILVKALHARPDHHLPAVECSLKVCIILERVDRFLPSIVLISWWLRPSRCRFCRCVCTSTRTRCSS